MTLKSLARVARLVGVVVSPLLTAPAAGAELERGTVALFARNGVPISPHARHPPPTTPRDASRGQRVSF